MPLESRYLIVLSEPDPVASAVRRELGALPSSGQFVDGTPIRLTSNGVGVLARGTLHIHDDELDRRLPLTAAGPTTAIVFPSIHRSASGQPGFTVHALGNPGDANDSGGAARTLVPAPARLMASALRQLVDGGEELGLGASYEATHHGPTSHRPAFFMEIGFGEADAPPAEAVAHLAETLLYLEPDDRDVIALGVGGGHYAPHFTDLAVERCVAFGHVLSKHAGSSIDRALAVKAWEATPGAAGIVYASAAEARGSIWSALGRKIPEAELERRTGGSTQKRPERSRGGGGPASGT